MTIIKTTISKLSLGVIAFAFASPGFAQKVPVDTTASTLKWIGKKVTGQHDGKILIKEGSFELKKDALVGGSFEIDMKSITVEDIKDDKKANASLVGHLKNDDFFGVDKFPLSKVVIKKVLALSKAEPTKSHTVLADLTIKGVTHPIEFPALISIKDGVVKAKATVAIDRTKYNIKYGSGKFFQGLGDKMINDEFSVELDVTAKVPSKLAAK